MKLIQELLSEGAKRSSVEIDLGVTCFTYNWPNEISSDGEKKLEKTGHLKAKGNANIKKYFSKLVDSANKALDENRIDTDKIEKIYPDFFMDVVEIQFKEIEISYNNDGFDDDDSGDKFPRNGSDATDSFRALIVLDGFDKSKVDSSKLNSLYEIIALHIASIAYGQYADNVDYAEEV